METTLGYIGIIGWCAIVFVGAVKIVLAVRRNGEWKPTHIYGLVAVAALSSGIILSIKNLLPDDTFGVGIILTICGGIALWGITYSDE